MMRTQIRSVFLLAVSIVFIMLFNLFGPLGMTVAAQAAPNIISITFTDTSPIQYTDQSGNISEGLHVGELRCIEDVCNQKIEFKLTSPQPTTDTIVYEYKFKSILAFDPVAERVIVTGTGTIINDGPKDRFLFTGVFQNNGDGTVQVTYSASNPEASFFFPAAPGTFSILSNN